MPITTRMASETRTIRPRFWLFISALLLTQLVAPALSSRRWEQFGKNADKRTLIEPTGRLDIPSDDQELIDFAKSNISASILNSEQTGLFTGTCLAEGRACTEVAAAGAVAGYSWTAVGKGLLEILKIGGIISAATCLSLSVASIATCGGLRSDTCQKYKDVKASMDGLKELASTAIDENAELRRWNASNLDIIYKLGSIQQEIETIVENNALLMDALGVLHYNSTPTDMRPDEAGDEYDKDLQKKKLEIEADIEQYLKSLDDKIAGMTGATSIAFAVFAGVSLLVQIAPAFLRGVRRLELGTVRVNELNVLVKSPTSGVGMAVNMKTGNKYFVEVSEGTVNKVLGKVGKDGGSMGGFFDMFASSKTKQKIGDFMNEEKISISRDRIGKANIKCSKSSLEKLADWTKDMDEVQFDDFLQKVKSSKEGTDNFISKATNKPDVEIKPPAKGGIMSKLTAKFKPVGQFFSKVKSAIKSVTAGFRKTKVWQGLKKYGFDAFGAIMAAASIGMCIHQVVTTVKGAEEMNRKIDNTAAQIKQSRADLTAARENVAHITGLQGQLFFNLTRDSSSMLKFFVNDTTDPEDKPSAAMKRLKEEVAKETPRFRELLEKVSTVGSDQHSQSDLRHHLDDFKKLLADTRLSLIHIYQKVKMSIQIRNSVKNNIPVQIILRNLVASGFKVDGTFVVVNEIAWNNRDLDDYDNYPLNCIRKGTITSQLQLDQFMKSSGTEVISEQTKGTIMMAVDFFKSPVVDGERSIVNLLKTQQRMCGIAECTYDDVLRVIAKERPDWKEYDGYNLDDFRNSKATC